MFFIKFTVVFFGLILGFHFATKKYINPYRLYLVFGKKGSGKSTYLTKVAYQYARKGWNVYSNMQDLGIPHARYIDAEKLGFFIPEKNSLLILDEVGMIYDNRNFKNFKPEVRDFYKLQRKYKVVVYMASQSFDVDKKIRDLTDGMFLQTNFLRVFSLGRRIYRKVTLTEPVGDMESKIVESLKWAPIWNWTLTYIPKWGKYFETLEAPERPYFEYDEVLPDSPSLFKEKKQRIRVPFRMWKTASHFPDR